MKVCISLVLLVLTFVDINDATLTPDKIQHIFNALNELGVLPHSGLSSSVPEMEGIDSEHEHIKRCYSSAVGNQSINIFAGKAGLIIHQIVTEFREQIFPTDDLHGKIKTIVSNIRKLAKVIKKCIDNPDQQTKYGLTSMALLSHEDYNDMRKGLSDALFGDSASCDNNVDYSELPEEFDWREKGGVSQVKTQEICGSCYIFSALGSLESQFLIKRKQTVDLSEQAMVNCLSTGCSGGWMDAVWKLVKSNGVPLEQDVPYVSEPEECTEYKSFTKLSSYCFERKLSDDVLTDDQLRALIYKYGPSVGGVNTHDPEFQFVTGDYNFDCTSNKIDHAILVVGWTKDRWIIKNSWGEKWGDKGFFYLKRGNNNCGINRIMGVPQL